MSKRPEEISASQRVVTVPNVLSVSRLVGAYVLLAFALAGREQVFLWLFLALALTDWVDGKLAILLDQRTVLGARLDTCADVSLYAALLAGAWWLHADVLTPELGWIAAAVLSYAVSGAYALRKFGRWPSYHTRAAKTSWLLITLAALAVLSEWSVVPLRLATVWLVLTNLEAIVITYHLSDWRVDVRSVLSVVANSRDGAGSRSSDGGGTDGRSE